MRKVLLYTISFLVQLSTLAQSKKAEDYYISAFNEMSNMLAGRDSLSIKELYFLQNGHIMKGNWIIKLIFAMRLIE